MGQSEKCPDIEQFPITVTEIEGPHTFHLVSYTLLPLIQSPHTPSHTLLTRFTLQLKGMVGSINCYILLNVHTIVLPSGLSQFYFSDHFMN